MKKYIALLLIFLMLLTLAACRRQPNALSENFDPGTPVVVTPSPEPIIPGVEVMDIPIDVAIDDSSTPIPAVTPDKDSEDSTLSAPSTPNNAAQQINTPRPEQTENSTTPTDSPLNSSTPENTEAPVATLAPEAGHIANTTAYEQYNNMSGDEQLAFYRTFDSSEAFIAWYNAAKADYEASNPAIEITGDVIDLGELLG